MSENKTVWTKNKALQEGGDLADAAKVIEVIADELYEKASNDFRNSDFLEDDKIYYITVSIKEVAS